jgi:hypothetical protein
MVSLEILVLQENNLTGPIPTGLSAANLLTEINFESNSLTGAHALTLYCNLCNLCYSGDLCDLSGAPPCTYTKYLCIFCYITFYTGPLGSLIVELPLLELFLVSDNRLTGTIPSTNNGGNLKTTNGGPLKGLFLSSNCLTGTLPVSLTDFADLSELMIDTGSLSGTLPEEYSSFVNMSFLILAANSFNGTLPEGWSNMSSLQALAVNENRLTGTLPDLSSLSSLFAFGINDNKLTGTVPTTYGRLTSLFFLALENNSFTGTLPEELSNLNNLEVLSAQLNFFTGDKPDFGNFTFTYFPQRSLAVDLDEYPTVQLETLQILYDSLGGFNWTNNTGWRDLSNETSLDSLFGVFTEEDDSSTIIEINLSENNLQGELWIRCIHNH